MEKSLGLPFTHDGVGLTPWEVAIYLLFHSFNATEGQDGLSFSYLLSKPSKMVQFAPYKGTLSSVQFNLITHKRKTSLRGLIRSCQGVMFIGSSKNCLPNL